jgi:hypothetical protein
MTTPYLAGLCERLRRTRTVLRLEAATAIESLVAENDQMREALKPFATYLYLDGDAKLIWPDDMEIAGYVNAGGARTTLTFGDLRRARTALEGASDDR